MNETLSGACRGQDPRLVDLQRVAGMCSTLGRTARQRWQMIQVHPRTEAEGIMYAHDRGVMQACEDIRLRIQAMMRGPYVEPTAEEDRPA